MVTDFSKQTELIKVHEFKERINVIGCGALGSWIVFFLLKMGFENIHVYDYDEVEEHNLPNQMFSENQIGKKKVEGIAETYGMFFNDDDNRLTIHDEKVTEANARQLGGITFCAVDSMMWRKKLYEHVMKFGTGQFWVEGRLGLFGAYVYCVETRDMNAFREYEGTFYDDEEAEVSACGVSQTALPSAVNCASVMIMQMLRWFRGEDYLNKVEYQIPEMYAMQANWKRQ